MHSNRPTTLLYTVVQPACLNLKGENFLPGGVFFLRKFFKKNNIFWALNANSFKMVEGTNFKFGTDAPRESPDMTPEKFFRKGGVARVT